MRVIDLLNKIANGEEVPKKIEYDDNIYEYDYVEKNYEYFFIDHYNYLFDEDIMQILDDEVEILEEEKKIPEKINVINWDKCIHNVTHKEKELAIEINKTQELLNQVIDYLKSKGDE